MIRPRALLSLLFAAAATAAGCSSGSELPGAVLHGPGPLAVFTGIVAHGDGSIRPYLAIGSERGDELRLLDATDNEIVESPGLVFPLSVPSSGRPMLVASAGLGDGVQPDALGVVSAGSSVVELVDTWSAYPTVVARVEPLPGAEILSLLGAPVPNGTGGVVPGKARFVAGLAGGKLAVIELSRVGSTLAIAAAAPVVVTLGFDAVSLARSDNPDHVFAATQDLLPGSIQGVAMIALPPSPAGFTVTAIDARAPTTAVAALTLDPWKFPTPGTPQADTWLPSAERVVAVPVASECGLGKPVRCGLLALDPGTLAQVPDPTGEQPGLLPITLPAPVTALVATGRTAAALLTAASAVASLETTGLAVFTAANGRVYLVDVARWAMVNDVSPVAGTGRARAGAFSSTPGAASSIGLWSRDGTTLSMAAALAASLPARVRVTPGFTPDDDWTLAWQGTLPGLADRAARVRWDGAALVVAVQIEAATTLDVASLAPLGVVANQTTVQIAGTGNACLDGAELPVTALVADAAFPGGAAQVTPPACFGTPAAFASIPGKATFLATGLLLSGARTGFAGRPALNLVAPSTKGAEHLVTGPRLFYVTDACAAGSECAATWTDPPLAFPLPSGPALGISPGLLDAAGLPTGTLPSRGTALHFSTYSGLVPSGRHPIVSGASTVSTLPLGLAFIDAKTAGTGAHLFASYTSGQVMVFDSNAGPGTMAVVR